MKASELIKIIQEQIDHYGDEEILIDPCEAGCDILGGCIPHDNLGFLGGNERAYLIECAETHRQFVADEIAASEGY